MDVYQNIKRPRKGESDEAVFWHHLYELQLKIDSIYKQFRDDDIADPNMSYKGIQRVNQLMNQQRNTLNDLSKITTKTKDVERWIKQIKNWKEEYKAN
jgi:hypothetical protein